MSEDRKVWLSLLAKAPAVELAERWRATGLSLRFTHLRAPEIGAVMTRGRVGATGAPFNLGEITVSRCSIRLESGEVGHGYVQGRDKAKAELAAVIDAAMQTGAAAAIRRDVLDPIAAGMDAAREVLRRRAAATKVDFFTVSRGED